MLVGFKEVWQNKSLLLLTMAFSSFIGLYFSLGNVMSSIFNPIGFSPMQISAIGLTMLAFGIIGATLTGWFLDKTNAYKKLLMFLIGISLVTFSLLAHQIIVTRSLTIMICYMAVLGMAMISVLPTSLGLGVELSFPLQPALVNGVMYMFAQALGCAQSLAYSFTMEVDINDYATAEEVTEARQHRIFYLAIVFVVVILFSLVCLIFVKEDLKRLRFNQYKNEEP